MPRKIWVLVAVWLIGTVAVRAADAELDRRAEELLGKLTLEEKAALCHGDFVSGGVPRLGIPRLMMLDGRQGLRPMDNAVAHTTSLPCALALACTWDERAAEHFGAVLAEEMLALDKHVLLAPMINLVRTPLAGRNFENFSEDPCLSARITAAYVRGVQALRVAACSCLVAANDCETRRHFTSSNLDERTLREVHLLPTELSFTDAGVWTMMSANSLIDGVHCAQNHRLLQEIVKDRIGFDGVMITDWRAAYDTVPAALAGTDMTTGFCKYVFGDGRLVEAVKSGQVPQSLLDEKARRVLKLYIRCGLLDPGSRAKGELDSPKHRRQARQLGAQGIVLLKNENKLLPLDTSKVKSILVTGPAADVALQGGGSGGNIKPGVEISPLRGLETALAGKAKIVYAPFKAVLTPALEKGSAEWARAQKKGAKKKAPAAKAGAAAAPDLVGLTKQAQAADAVIFMAAGVQASEGRDLATMDLPGGQAEAIAALAQANPNVVVVLVASGAVTVEPWLDKAPALVAAHYAGQATGDALADVLTGKVNPGGKLSYTFGRKLADYPCHALGEWPAKLILDKDPVNPGMTPAERKATHAFDTDYKEGVFVGYRWFDEKKIEPVFPFGHGLSYTTFALGDLNVSERGGALSVSCEVKNTGGRAGTEVVQVYIAPPKSSVPRPPKELRGFAKVALGPGESKRVEIALRPSALAYFDVGSEKWKADAGEYEIQVGCSSRDIRLRVKTSLASEKIVERY